MIHRPLHARATLLLGVGVLACVALAACALSGCAEERVVAVRGGIQNMPGAQGGVKADGHAETNSPGKDYDNLLAKYNKQHEDDTLVPDKNHPLRLVDPNDPTKVVLLLRSPQDLVIQLYETLQNKEYDLLYEQVISDQLKENYREQFKDPHEAVDYLRRNAGEIRKLIATMPAADQTPGLFLQPIGQNMFRIEAPGRGALDMKFQKLDVILENGQFKLLLIS